MTKDSPPRSAHSPGRASEVRSIGLDSSATDPSISHPHSPKRMVLQECSAGTSAAVGNNSPATLHFAPCTVYVFWLASESYFYLRQDSSRRRVDSEASAKARTAS